jgi:hypothetical protein
MALAEFDDLSEAIQLAAKVDFVAVSAAERTAAVVELQRLKARLAALESAAVSAFDAAMDWAPAGHRSAKVALRHRCRMHGGEAGAVVSLARALRSMPGTELALADGAITVNHARRLARAASRPEFADAEAFLLEKAGSLSFRDFQRAVAYWEQVVDEARRDDGDPEPADPRETNRAAHVSKTISDMTRVDAWLDPIGGTAFREALRRIEQEFFDADWQQAKAERGDAVTIDRLWRTPAQRRADALVEMAVRASTAPADGQRPLPLVIIHVDIDTFTIALSNYLGVEGPAPAGGVERLCELDDGTVISPTQMIEQALAGHVRRLVFESPGVILDYGRKQRLFTGALRQAVCARDRVCDHAGCEIPARHCEIDHVQDWDHGGHTSHHNGKARCSYHHRNWKPRPG